MQSQPIVTFQGLRQQLLRYEITEASGVIYLDEVNTVMGTLNKIYVDNPPYEGMASFNRWEDAEIQRKVTGIESSFFMVGIDHNENKLSEWLNRWLVFFQVDFFTLILLMEWQPTFIFGNDSYYLFSSEQEGGIISTLTKKHQATLNRRTYTVQDWRESILYFLNQYNSLEEAGRASLYDLATYQDDVVAGYGCYQPYDSVSGGDTDNISNFIKAFRELSGDKNWGTYYNGEIELYNTKR